MRSAIYKGDPADEVLLYKNVVGKDTRAKRYKYYFIYILGGCGGRCPPYKIKSDSNNQQLTTNMK